MEKGRYDISVDELYEKHYKNHKGKFYSMRHGDFSPIGDEHMCFMMCLSVVSNSTLIFIT